MELSQLSGHIAFALIACSFLVQNILTLRIISIVSSIAAIIYNFYALGEPLWLVINWNIIFITIHLLNIGIHSYRNRKIDFDKDEKLVYEKIFKDISHTDFLELMNIGKTIYLKKDLLIMREGKPYDDIVLVLKGKLELICKGKALAKIEKGNFIGENNIFDIKCQNSFVTVKVSEPVKCIVWKKKDLIKYLKKNEEIQKVFLLIVNKNMTEKIKIQAEHL